MRSQAAGRTTRVKKLAKHTSQPILREDELDSAEYNSLQTQTIVETGVEKSEEKEIHLQNALRGGSGSGNDAEEIPAPPAEETDGLDYDALYPLVFKKPATYIRYSQTVEETTGCQYDMSTEDDIFLKNYNQKKSSSNKCSEDEFEWIMFIMEETSKITAPYAAVDGTVISFETMKAAIKPERGDGALAFAKDLYEHWRQRRQNSGNNRLQPELKAEKNPTDDDGDPYVCFRRRDARQTRKTRARDVQSVDKLKQLRRQLEDGRSVIDMAMAREQTKTELLKCERSVFEQRAKFKDVKVKLGIKTDDDDLINQKPQKRKVSEFGQLQRPPGTQIRLPGRSDGRPLDADLILLSDILAQKENALQTEIEDKAQQHRKWNANHVDLTREPLSPVNGLGYETGFRPATAQYQYLMTPPSSVTSESFDHPSPTLEKTEVLALDYHSPSEDDEFQSRPAYRRRFGRGGRLWIDRRGMSCAANLAETTVSDRWKYDRDDDEEQTVYEMDPNDTKALRFRATIPYPPHLFSQRPRAEQQAAQLARTAGNSPANRAAIGQHPQQAPT